MANAIVKIESRDLLPFVSSSVNLLIGPRPFMAVVVPSSDSPGDCAHLFAAVTGLQGW